MEEATGAPSSFTVYDPKRLRASGRDGGGVMNRPPSSLSMLLSRHTKRRAFITLLGGAAAAWPKVARAQQSAMPVVGFMGLTTPEGYGSTVEGVRKGLTEAGLVEGRNLKIEFAWAESR